MSGSTARPSRPSCSSRRCCARCPRRRLPWNPCVSYASVVRRCGSDIRRARRYFGEDTTFKNIMGSAEMGIVATYEIPGEQADDEPVPCGRATAGVELSVVDPETGARVAPGEPGHLMIVREGLSIGYWRDPELTRQAHFTTPDGRRGFRSSDLVTLRSDGVLEHHGRLDDRIKIRGTMVAPAGVEAAPSPPEWWPTWPSSRPRIPTAARSSSPTSCPRPARP